MSIEQARRIRELEEEPSATREKLAQAVLEVDLLKKHPNSPFASASRGYIDTQRRLARSRGGVPNDRSVGLDVLLPAQTPAGLARARGRGAARCHRSGAGRLPEGRLPHTVQRYLRRRGRFVGERRIRQEMKRFSLHAEIKRAFVHTTDSNHSHRARVYPKTGCPGGASLASTRPGRRISPTSAS